MKRRTRRCWILLDQTGKAPMFVILNEPAWRERAKGTSPSGFPCVEGTLTWPAPAAKRKPR